MFRPRLCERGELYYSQAMTEEAKKAIEDWENLGDNLSFTWVSMETSQDYFTAGFEKLSQEKLESSIAQYESNFNNEESAQKCSLKCPKCRNITRYVQYWESSGGDHYYFICKDCRMFINIFDCC